MIIAAVKQYAVPYPQRFFLSDCKLRQLEMLGLISHHSIVSSVLHFYVKEF